MVVKQLPTKKYLVLKQLSYIQISGSKAINSQIYDFKAINSQISGPKAINLHSIYLVFKQLPYQISGAIAVNSQIFGPKNNSQIFELKTIHTRDI